MRDFYATSYSNVHRGVYTLSERATEGYEGAREKVRAFLNAPSTREVIFTRKATEALNLVAYAWGLDNLGPGDVVSSPSSSTTRTSCPGSRSRGAPAPTSGCCRSTTSASCGWTCSTRSPATRTVKVVAANLVSNSLGTINPIERLAAWAHERGAIMVVDAAQAAPHRRIDVQTLGCRLRRVLVAQDVRPDRRRASSGAARELLEAM